MYMQANGHPEKKLTRIQKSFEGVYAHSMDRIDLPAQNPNNRKNSYITKKTLNYVMLILTRQR